MENLKKLIENEGWLPIINIKYPHKNYQDSQRECWYTAESDVSLLKTSRGDIILGRAIEGQKGITHFMPLDTPERMAKVIAVLVKALESALFGTESGYYTGTTIKTGLQKANEIAGE